MDLNELLASLAPAGTGTLAPSPAGPAPMAPAPAPAQAPAPIVSRGTPQMPPPAPLPTQQDLISGAQNTGEAIMGQYTPEKRMALYQAMLQARNSTGTMAGKGLASVGDAIVNSLGGHSTGLAQANEQQNKAQEGMMGEFDAGAKLRSGEIESGLGMNKMMPNSPVSKIAQDSFSAPLKMMGYSDAAIARMPASQIETLTGVALKFADIKTQEALKEATLKMTAQMNGMQVKQRQEEIDRLGDVEAAKHWALHPQLAKQATARLASGSGGAAPAPAAPTLAPGEVVRKTTDGKSAVFDEATKSFKRYQ